MNDSGAELNDRLRRAVSVTVLSQRESLFGIWLTNLHRNFAWTPKKWQQCGKPRQTSRNRKLTTAMEVSQFFVSFSNG